jgi:recombination protein RecT
MANQNQETRVAVRDAEIVERIDRWGEANIAELFQGRNFRAWKQDAALAVIENKDLRACVATEDGRISLVRALQRSATSGLSLNPQKGESALVPINGKVNFWPMKNGLIKAALETGALEYVEANTIFSGDSFSIKKTAKGDDYEFTPSLQERGIPVAYFAVAVLSSGRSVVEYWDKGQVEGHKKKYGKGLGNTTSAWNTNFDGMAEKTVIRSVLNSLHLPEIEELFGAEDAAAEAMRDVTEPQPHKGASAEDLEAELARREAGEKAAAGEATKYGNAPPQGNPEQPDIF